MSEEQYIHMMGESINRVVQFNLTIPTFIAAMLDGPKSELYKWMSAGNDLDTTLVPRRMLPEIESQLGARGIPYTITDPDGHSSQVQLITRGPGEYLIDNVGEYRIDEKDETHRMVNMFNERNHDGDRNGDKFGDRTVVRKILEGVEKEYQHKLEANYILSVDEANKEFADQTVSSIQNLSYEQADLFQEMCKYDFVKTFMRFDPASRTYTVEFLESELSKGSITGLSPVELALQRTLMVGARPEVNEWLKKTKFTNENIKDYLITVQNPKVEKIQPMVMIEAGNNTFDQLQNKIYTKLIEIDANKQATIIDNTIPGHNEITYLDLTKEEDYKRFIMEAASMESKYFLSKDTFDRASQDIKTFNLYIERDDELYKKYLDGIEIGKYEAEKLTDLGVWMTRFEDTKVKNKDKDYDIVRTIECRVPDSDKIINVLGEDTTDLSKSERDVEFYNIVNQNIEHAKNQLYIAPPATFESASDAFYETSVEVAIRTKALEVGFDLQNATKEQAEEFYNSHFNNDKVIKVDNDKKAPEFDADQDGIDDRNDSWLDTDQDGVDDREPEHEEDESVWDF